MAGQLQNNAQLSTVLIRVTATRLNALMDTTAPACAWHGAARARGEGHSSRSTGPPYHRLHGTTCHSYHIRMGHFVQFVALACRSAGLGPAAPQVVGRVIHLRLRELLCRRLWALGERAQGRLLAHSSEYPDTVIRRCGVAARTAAATRARECHRRCRHVYNVWFMQLPLPQPPLPLLHEG